MKKTIIFLIIIISLIPFISKKNDYKDITTVNYISSIGIDYDVDTNEFIVYSYILNNLNLASNQSAPGDSESMSYIIKNKSNNLHDAFVKIKDQINISLFYTHLETIILTNNFFSVNNIKNFYFFIRDSIEIYPTFYIFTTDSKLDDIFNIEYLTDISGYHTLLVNPTLRKSHNFITFVDFAKMYLVDNFTLLIPHIISIEDIFYKQNQTSNLLEIDGYSKIDNTGIKINLLESENNSIKWLKKLVNEYITIDNYSLYIKDFSLKIKKKKNNININIQISSIITQNIDNQKYAILEEKFTKIVKNEISELIISNLKKDIDLLNIKYLCNINKIEYDKLNFNIKFKVY